MKIPVLPTLELPPNGAAEGSEVVASATGRMRVVHAYTPAEIKIYVGVTRRAQNVLNWAIAHGLRSMFGSDNCLISVLQSASVSQYVCRDRHGCPDRGWQFGIAGMTALKLAIDVANGDMPARETVEHVAAVGYGGASTFADMIRCGEVSIVVLVEIPGVIPESLPKGNRLLYCPIEDGEEGARKLEAEFDRILGFVEVSPPAHTIMFVCQMGISRSVSAAISVILAKFSPGCWVEPTAQRIGYTDLSLFGLGPEEFETESSTKADAEIDTMLSGVESIASAIQRGRRFILPKSCFEPMMNRLASRKGHMGKLTGPWRFEQTLGDGR